ncbi:MAG: hypothetical protein CMM94_03715 [Rickettsiales bacterium]|nr:hypothetical protein [Rickettsiales bacterium]
MKKQIIKNEEGATAIEFAIVAPVLFLLIFGIIEFGLITFSTVAIEAAASDVTRHARTGALSTAEIRQAVKQHSLGLINADRIVVTTQQVYNSPLTAGEPCIPSDAKDPQTGVCLAGYEDVNGNGIYDAPLDAGAAGEVREYTIVYPYQIITPMMGTIIGQSSRGYDGNTFVIASRAMVKNEPF